jgi:hypothetical protein
MCGINGNVVMSRKLPTYCESHAEPSQRQSPVTVVDTEHDRRQWMRALSIYCGAMPRVTVANRFAGKPLNQTLCT